MYGFRAKRGKKLYISTAHQYITLRNPQIKLLSILIQFCSLDTFVKMNGINVFIFVLIFTSVSLNKIEQNITRDDRICKRFQFFSPLIASADSCSFFFLLSSFFFYLSPFFQILPFTCNFM